MTQGITDDMSTLIQGMAGFSQQAIAWSTGLPGVGVTFSPFRYFPNFSKWWKQW